MTPLMNSIQGGEFAITRRLLELKANTAGALHAAVEHNAPDMIELLLKNGANIELQNKVGAYANAFSILFLCTFCVLDRSS
jgi:ankyrin repeat protein